MFSGNALNDIIKSPLDPIQPKTNRLSAATDLGIAKWIESVSSVVTKEKWKMDRMQVEPLGGRTGFREKGARPLRRGEGQDEYGAGLKRGKYEDQGDYGAGLR